MRGTERQQGDFDETETNDNGNTPEMAPAEGKDAADPESARQTAPRPGAKFREEYQFMTRTSSSKRPAAFSRIAYFALLFVTVAAASLHLGVPTAQAATASLSWTAPTTHTDGTALTNLAGYKLCTGTTSGSYSQVLDVGKVTSYSLTSLNDATTYYFAVTAYDTAGNTSGYSNQATFTTATLPPPNPLYTLTASAGSGGTITPSGALVVSQGANQTYSITPGTGYKVAGVTVDGASVGAVSSYTFSNVAANHTIAASFAASTTNNYTVTASAGTGGSISPTGATSVASGASQAYTVSPSTGYYTVSVTVDGTVVATNQGFYNYTFSNVAANHTISATFALAMYHVVASVGTGGSITPAGTTAVSYGASSTYTITPSTGYKVASVTVDGASVGAVTSYTFSSVAANHTIAATFTTGSSTVFAVNSAGAQYKSVAGDTYLADTKFTGGSTNSTTAAISGTSDGTLYQSERYGNFSYNVPVANGNYLVTLKFAEIYFTAAGQRVFNVTVNGQTAASNLDVYAKVGKNAAYDLVVPVSVTNGAISINFASVVNYAKVGAILIKSN